MNIQCVCEKGVRISHPQLPGGELTLDYEEKTKLRRPIYNAVAKQLQHKVINLDSPSYGIPAGATEVAVVEQKPVEQKPTAQTEQKPGSEQNTATPTPTPENMEWVASIAQKCHEANREYCLSIGDDSQPTWEDAPEWQKKSAITGVMSVLNNPGVTTEELHAKWMEQKLAEGWVYGETKDVEKKTHPCIMSYDQLPEAQKIKDKIFRETVLAEDTQPAKDALPAEPAKSAEEPNPVKSNVEPTEELKCSKCGRVCKSKIGLQSHETACIGKGEAK